MAAANSGSMGRGKAFVTMGVRATQTTPSLSPGERIVLSRGEAAGMQVRMPARDDAPRAVAYLRQA